MADHSKPLTTSLYADFVTELDGRFDDLAVGLDPAVTTATNVPTNSIRWTSASNKWQKWNGTTWGDLSASYGINISGTAAGLSATLATTSGGTGLTSFTSGGAVYASSTSALITGTLPATAGGTGNASYAIGDIIYASTTTALSRLADVATGNSLISGGVGVAPSWGKIGLTTHVTGTLAATNGGTGNASYAVGDLLYASTTTALSRLADVATGNSLISGGVGVAPTWGKIGLTTHISGTLAIGNGGTGSALTDPSADRILFWDDSAGAVTWLTVSTGLSLSGTTLTATGSGGTVTSVAAGNGMTFTTITGSGTVTMGTPSAITNTTTNSVSAGTHTHSLTGELVETTTGSAPYYGARAWVNFNGQGTVAIRASYNVSSITDLGTGQYTINMTNAMVDNNYAAVISVSARPDGGDAGAINFNYQSTYALTASAFNIVGPKTPGTTIQDGLIYTAVVFR